MVPIYILVTLLFAIYVPELFPTEEVRMRASGICNTFGRGATIVTPFIVVALLKSHGIGGVLSFIIGLLIVQILLVLFFWGSNLRTAASKRSIARYLLSPLPEGGISL